MHCITISIDHDEQEYLLMLEIRHQHISHEDLVLRNLRFVSMIFIVVEPEHMEIR